MFLSVILIIAAILAIIIFRKNQKLVEETNNWLETQEKLMHDQSVPFHKLTEDIIVRLEPQFIDDLEKYTPPGYSVLTMTAHGNFLYIVLRKQVNSLEKTTH